MRKATICAAMTGLALVAPIGVGAASASTGRPRAATHLTMSARSTHSLTLHWRNPTGAHFAAIVIRYRKGGTAPATPHAGTKLVTIKHPKTRYSHYTKTHLAAHTRYAFSVFATDLHGHYARPAKVSALTRAAAPSTTTQYDGKWAGVATDPDDSRTTTQVTFTVKDGKLTDFLGYVYSDCPDDLESVYVPGPIDVSGGEGSGNGIVNAGPGENAVSSMTAFFKGSSASGSMQFQFTGLECSSSHWPWTATKD